jgi:uncharacterized membrane protein
LKSKLRLLALSLSDSFWFVPAGVVLASMLVAAALVELDTFQAGELAEWSPRLFGASAEGSRAMLSAIATSMITVAGVVFSITVVVLSQASTQYSPRVLRNFMRDRPTQAVLGVFVGVFAYCLMVLRTVRGSEEAFIPSLAVLGAMVYAFGAIAMLIFFIHHVAQSIQASAIVDRIAQETEAAIDDLFPEKLADAPDRGQDVAPPPGAWDPVHADRCGYVVSVDAEALLRETIRHGRVVRIVPAVGAFVPQGGTVLEVGGVPPPSATEAAALRSCVVIDRQRTPVQDAAFGLQQLVDVAIKALSPGINDPSTAALCIDRLSDLLARLSGRRFPEPARFHEGRLAIIAPVPVFGDMLMDVVQPLIAYGRGDALVLHRLVRALAITAAHARDPVRRRAVNAAASELLRPLGTRRRASPTRRKALAELRSLISETSPDGPD